ncbi:Six-hairpin glycosidase-like protein [Aspergillus navahoensis]
MRSICQTQGVNDLHFPLRMDFGVVPQCPGDGEVHVKERADFETILETTSRSEYFPPGGIQTSLLGTNTTEQRPHFRRSYKLQTTHSSRLGLEDIIAEASKPPSASTAQNATGLSGPGTLEFILDVQQESGSNAGLSAISPGMGDAAKYANVYKSFGLLEYQMLFFSSLERYYLDSADIELVHGYWERIRAGVEAMLPLVDDSPGLATVGSLGAFFVGDSNDTAASALLAYTLARMAEMAEVVGEPATASRRNEAAKNLSFAVNQKLWNESVGTYSSSLTALDEFSLLGTAWAILSNTANTSQASSIAVLSTLRLGIGYKTTSDNASEPSTNLYPNLLGFLLEARFKHARREPYHAATLEAIDLLLNGLWAAMV